MNVEHARIHLREASQHIGACEKGIMKGDALQAREGYRNASIEINKAMRETQYCNNARFDERLLVLKARLDRLLADVMILK